MTSPYADWKRDGLASLLKLAKALCSIVTTFAGIIRSKYSDQPNILALLAAIEAVCQLLPDAIADYDAFSPEDDPYPADTATLAGIDENAPDAPEPDII